MPSLQVYYANKRARKAKAKSNNGFDDENHDYIIKIGEVTFHPPIHTDAVVP